MKLIKEVIDILIGLPLQFIMFLIEL